MRCFTPNIRKYEILRMIYRCPTPGPLAVFFGIPHYSKRKSVELVQRPPENETRHVRFQTFFNTPVEAFSLLHESTVTEGEDRAVRSR